MNKKQTEFFTGLGMTAQKNNAYGVVHGFELNATIVPMNTASPLQLHFSCYTTDEQKRNVEAALRAAKIKFCNFRFTPYGLLLGLNDFTFGKLLKRLPALVESVADTLRANEALGAEFCPVCGRALDPETAQKCALENATITMDAECKNNINALINEENKDFENAPNNYLKGFVGALIGGLAGAAIAVLLYLVGFVSSLSALVSVVLGAFLYQKFQGKPNKGMICIVAATTLACMVISIFGVYIVAAGIAAAEEGLSMTAFEAFRICMRDAEFSRLFYADLALVLLFSAIGIGWEIFTLIKKIKRQKPIQ